MKKSILIFLFLFIMHCTLNTKYCFGQWVEVSNGMGFYKSVLSLTASGPYIFAGTDWGVYLSSNNGLNWIQTLYYRNVYSFTILGNNIFAGTDWGVYLSSNNGLNWNQTSLNNRLINCLASDGNNIFAGTLGNGVYISSNNGKSWTQSGLNNLEVYSLALIAGNSIFAGTYPNGVYLSNNNGLNWIQTSLNTTVCSFAFSSNNIFAGDYGVYLSTNNGLIWTLIGLHFIHIYSLAISDSNMFAGTGGNGVYHTTNNGIIWTQKNQGFEGSVTCNALLISNKYIYAGTNHNVWRRSVSDIISNINHVNSVVPSEFSLSQNYPNPFNPTTKIIFDVPLANGIGEGLGVRLVIYDLLGREVATLVNENLKHGSFEAEWSASNYPSGVYFYRLITNDFTEVKKMVLLK